MEQGLYLRGKTWWLRWTVDKKQQRICLKTTDLPTAEKLAIAYKLNPHLAAILTWDYELKHWEAEAREFGTHTQASIRSTKEVVGLFFRTGGFKTPQEVDTLKAVQWLDRTFDERKLTSATFATYWARLTTFFRWLQEKNKIRTNPFLIKNRPKMRLRAINPDELLSKEEVRALIEGAPTEELRFILFCGFHAGMRASEIQNACPDWFNLKTNAITVWGVQVIRGIFFRTKNKKDRQIGISPQFGEWLKNQTLFDLKEKDTFCIYPEPRPRKKRAKHPRRYRYDFRRPLQEYAGINPHLMRHTFASLAITAGKPIATVAKSLGNRIAVAEVIYAKHIPKKGEWKGVF